MKGSHLLIGWCKCGPYADELATIASSPAKATVEWSGKSRWVSRSVHPRAGDRVELCEADLCHRPGQAHPIATGRLISVEERGSSLRLAIEYWPLEEDRGWIGAEYGKLVSLT